MSLYSVKFYFEEYRSEIRKTGITTLSKALGLFKEQVTMYKNEGLKPYKAEILKDSKVHFEFSLEISPKEKIKLSCDNRIDGESNVNVNKFSDISSNEEIENDNVTGFSLGGEKY